MNTEFAVKPYGVVIRNVRFLHWLGSWPGIPVYSVITRYLTLWEQVQFFLGQREFPFYAPLHLTTDWDLHDD